MQRLDNDPPLKIRRTTRLKNALNTERLRKAEFKLRIGAAGYTPMKFLQEVSHSFSTSNKKYFAQLIENLDEDPIMGGDIHEHEDEDDDAEVIMKYKFISSVSNTVGNLLMCTKFHLGK